MVEGAHAETGSFTTATTAAERSGRGAARTADAGAGTLAVDRAATNTTNS